MAIQLIVSKANNNLTDGSTVFNLIITQIFTGLGEENEIIINCQDEKHQNRLLDELLIAGFRQV